MVDYIPNWKALIFKPEEKKLYLALISSYQIVGDGCDNLRVKIVHSVTPMVSAPVSSCPPEAGEPLGESHVRSCTLGVEELNFILIAIT